MGALLEVKVLPRADHSERSEAQLHEGNLFRTLKLMRELPLPREQVPMVGCAGAGVDGDGRVTGRR